MTTSASSNFVASKSWDKRPNCRATVSNWSCLGTPGSDEKWGVSPSKIQSKSNLETQKQKLKKVGKKKRRKKKKEKKKKRSLPFSGHENHWAVCFKSDAPRDTAALNSTKAVAPTAAAWVMIVLFLSLATKERMQKSYENTNKNITFYSYPNLILQIVLAKQSISFQHSTAVKLVTAVHQLPTAPLAQLWSLWTRRPDGAEKNRHPETKQLDPSVLWCFQQFKKIITYIN